MIIDKKTDRGYTILSVKYSQAYPTPDPDSAWERSIDLEAHYRKVLEKYVKNEIVGDAPHDLRTVVRKLKAMQSYNPEYDKALSQILYIADNLS